jgi:hypothetical protein
MGQELKNKLMAFIDHLALIWLKKVRRRRKISRAFVLNA